MYSQCYDRRQQIIIGLVALYRENNFLKFYIPLRHSRGKLTTPCSVQKKPANIDA